MKYGSLSREPLGFLLPIFSLLPRFRRRGNLGAFAFALDDDFHGMPDLHRIERIRVVVDVFDLLPGKLDDGIPAFEPGCRRVRR